MTLKQRFRKALFAFFKEEILEAVKNPDVGLKSPHATNYQVETRTVDVKKIGYSMDFDESEYRGRFPQVPIEVILEEQINKARKEMFEAAIPYIELSTEELFDPKLYGKRRFVFSLFIGKWK